MCFHEDHGYQSRPPSSNNDEKQLDHHDNDVYVTVLAAVSVSFFSTEIDRLGSAMQATYALFVLHQSLINTFVVMF